MGLATFRTHRLAMPRRDRVRTPEAEAAELRDKLVLAGREIALRDARIAELEALLTEPDAKHTERRPRR